VDQLLLDELTRVRVEESDLLFPRVQITSDEDHELSPPFV
jgi:hypothetical protein